MTRWTKFKRLPLIGKVVLILFTPLAFLEIFIVSMSALVDSVAHFWANKKEETNNARAKQAKTEGKP